MAELYQVVIPGWSEGKPLAMRGIVAASGQEAEAKVVEWINKRAGYHYCDKLPPGSSIARTSPRPEGYCHGFSVAELMFHDEDRPDWRNPFAEGSDEHAGFADGAYIMLRTT